MEFRYGHDDVIPQISEVHWSEHPPVTVSAELEFKREFYVETEKLCEWINFFLDKGDVQFGSNIYTTPAK